MNSIVELERVKTMKCECCKDGMMQAFAYDTQYFYFWCKKCKTERLIPRDEVDDL